jgi:hypothetical protein
LLRFSLLFAGEVYIENRQTAFLHGNLHTKTAPIMFSLAESGHMYVQIGVLDMIDQNTRRATSDARSVTPHAPAAVGIR